MNKPRTLIAKSYNISYDPVCTKYQKKLSAKLMDTYEKFVVRIQNTDFSMADELRAILEKHENPVFYNLFYNCLIMAKRSDEAAEVAEINFNKFPDYLFARLNYASQLVYKQDFKSIPKLFNFHFDLSSLEPGRDTFHVSETLSFQVCRILTGRNRK